MLFISPYYVTKTPSNESAVYWSRDRRKSRDQYTALPLAEVLVTQYGQYGLYVIILSSISIRNAK